LRTASLARDGFAGASRALSAAGTFALRLKAKAEFARIGHYYATESMLVWDEANKRYDADATPETGEETLSDIYERLARGEAAADLGAHRAF
jgi:divinyl chlorophyllide a 8-vinyl-reductase